MALEELCKSAPRRIYAAEGIIAELSGISGATLIPLSPFRIVKAEGYTVLPLPANHRTDNIGETPLNFLIEHEGQTVFCGLDGAWINAQSWQVLSEVKLDCAILDCALGASPYSGECSEHNNLDMAARIKDIFISEGIAGENTKFFLSRIPSSKKLTLHEELSALAGELGFKLAYDGYFVMI